MLPQAPKVKDPCLNKYLLTSCHKPDRARKTRNSSCIKKKTKDSSLYYSMNHLIKHCMGFSNVKKFPPVSEVVTHNSNDRGHETDDGRAHNVAGDEKASNIPFMPLKAASGLLVIIK